jgi:squalene-hopene/tetraprenyl-beta-curcumene cyclase
MTPTSPSVRSLRQSPVDEVRIAPPRAGAVPPFPGDHADSDRALLDAAPEAIGRTRSWLLDRQAADGHWRAPLEGDTILESEFILLLAWVGRLDDARVRGAADRILREQLPTGGWAIHPDGPVDISASVKAYFALKLVGHAADEPDLRRARTAIAAAGGPWAVNSFTRFYLALLGQMPYAACPAVPPEAVLLPTWFPVNLSRVSAWSRTMIVPLSLMWAFKPRRSVPPSQGIAELFADGGAPRAVAAADTSWWARFFRGVDRAMKACEAVGLTPLRARAIQACRRWMLTRFDGSDGLGAIFPPMVWSIIALKSMGCDDDAPELREAWSRLDGLVEVEPGGITRLEPCRSPVWDTAITTIAVVESAAGGAAARAAADRAVDWLLANEIRSVGDWADRVQAEPSGWCFEYANRFYPDVDDTAMVVIAFSIWRGDAVPGARLAAVDAAIARAVVWTAAMQNADGGWGAFDRDNNSEFLCKVPFADHNAMIDPSSPDLAGRVLEALGRVGIGPGNPAVDRGLAYVRRTQEPDGSWYGRWGVNYIYGTWQVLEGLRAVGVPADDPAVLRGAAWLEDHQQAEGGWGETPESYADRSLAGSGPATASQTAWAIAGLVAAGRGRSAAVRRGMEWLLSRQEPDGSWEQPEFTGTGFPRVFYLRYHWYPIYFPLISLVRARRMIASGVLEKVA